MLTAQDLRSLTPSALRHLMNALYDLATSVSSPPWVRAAARSDRPDLTVPGRIVSLYSMTTHGDCPLWIREAAEAYTADCGLGDGSLTTQRIREALHLARGRLFKESLQRQLVEAGLAKHNQEIAS